MPTRSRSWSGRRTSRPRGPRRSDGHRRWPPLSDRRCQPRRPARCCTRRRCRSLRSPGTRACRQPLTTSQHAAAWDSPTSLMGCKRARRTNAIGGRCADATRTAARIGDDRLAARTEPEAVRGRSGRRRCARSPVSRPSEVTLKVSMLLLTFSVTMTCAPDGVKPICSGVAAADESETAACDDGYERVVGQHERADGVVALVEDHNPAAVRGDAHRDRCHRTAPRRRAAASRRRGSGSTRPCSTPALTTSSACPPSAT